MKDAALLEHHGAVALLTMNLAVKHNAIAPEMYKSLSRHTQDHSVRAVVLAGRVHFRAGVELDGLDASSIGQAPAAIA